MRNYGASKRLRLAVSAAALFLGSGCGGGAPAKARYAGPQNERAGSPGYPSQAQAQAGVREERDNDRDGILDKEDALPAEAAAMGQLAAKAPPPAPPPPPPGQPAPGAQPGTVAKPEPAPQDGKPDQAHQVQRDTSMIIYTARVTMAVYQVEQGVDAVERIARETGGYLALRKDGEITIRVPRARFQAALAQIDKIGDVVHRDVEAKDVTDEYVDVEIRIRNARVMRARLEELLKKAAVKEALEIERELHRITEELERLEGQLKLLKDKIAYSTITVTFQPRAAAIQTTRVRLPFPWLQQLGLPRLLSLSEDK